MKSLCVYVLSVALCVYHAAAQCDLTSTTQSNLQDFILTRVNAYRTLYGVTSAFAGGFQAVYDAATAKCENVPSTSVTNCNDPLPYQWMYTPTGGSAVSCCESASTTTNCAVQYLTNAGSNIAGPQSYIVLLAGNTTTAIDASNIEMYTDMLLNHMNSDKLLESSPNGQLTGYGVGVSTQAGADNKYYISFLLADQQVAATPPQTACAQYTGTVIASSSPVAMSTTTTTAATTSTATTMTSTSTSSSSSDASQTAVVSAAVLGAAVVATVGY